MALADGDMVIPAGVFNSVNGVANLSVGTLCPGGVPVGIAHVNGGNLLVHFNNGLSASVPSGSVAEVSYRKCTIYSGTNLMGKRVALTGKPAAFIGVVIQQFDTELDDTGGDGSQSPVVVVKTPQFTYIAEPSSLEEID